MRVEHFHLLKVCFFLFFFKCSLVGSKDTHVPQVSRRRRYLLLDHGYPLHGAIQDALELGEFRLVLTLLSKILASHWAKNDFLFFSPCWFQRKSITTGHMVYWPLLVLNFTTGACFFPGRLRQMEARVERFFLLGSNCFGPSMCSVERQEAENLGVVVVVLSPQSLFRFLRVLVLCVLFWQGT